MEQALPQIRFRCPGETTIEEVSQTKAMMPFSDASIGFLSDLSVELMNDPESKKYPDIVTFAFWIRKNSLLTMKKAYDQMDIRFGRGVVFHISPSNVPVNFAYSFVAGLLAGNANIVRLPSKDFIQVDLIIKSLQKVLDSGKHKPIEKHMVFIRYDHSDSVNRYLSDNCDVRVIWGGDHAISEIRKAKLPSRSFEITFADRYSICVIKAEACLKETNAARLANAFYNDTYLFDQNACTAPHLIYWIGNENEVEQAKTVFWHAVNQVTKTKYEMLAASSVQKLTTAYAFAASFDHVKIRSTEDKHIVRIELRELPKDLEQYRGAYGCFFECASSDLDSLSMIINRRYQTLSYFGLAKEEIESFLKDRAPSGIDRVVPIGETLAFSLIWDGFDLIESLSRKVVVI